MAPSFGVSLQIFRTPGLLLLGLGALTLLVALGPDPLPGEAGLIRSLQGRTGWARDGAEVIRVTTGTTGTLIVLFAFAPALLWRNGPWVLIPIGIALVTVLIIQPAFKELIDRPRPDESQVEVLATWESHAYPSGHAIGMTIVACYVGWLAIRRWRIPWAAPIVLLLPATIFGSLVQGVHWPTDLAGGMLLGGIAAWAMARTTPPDIARSRSLSSTP